MADGGRLQVGVDRFEARYAINDESGPPTIQVSGDAALIKAGEPRHVTSLRFSVEEVASANTKVPVATAFDRAGAGCTEQLVAWVNLGLITDRLNPPLGVPS